MTLQRFLINECSLLLLGIAVVFATAPAAKGPGNINPLIVLFLAIILCLVRASMTKRPDPDLSMRRRVASQVILAMALVLLMLFEIAFGMMVNFAQVPPAAWLVVCLVGVVYLSVSFVAHALGGLLDWPQADDEFLRDYENWTQR